MQFGFKMLMSLLTPWFHSSRSNYENRQGHGTGLKTNSIRGFSVHWRISRAW